MAPLIYNGTTIPTNVANALMYNGTSVTQVVFNGTTVWQQSLCQVCSGWSGNSYAYPASGGTYGFNVSGLSFRYLNNNTAYGWITINSSGVFNGATSGNTGSSGWGWMSSGSSLRAYQLTVVVGNYTWYYGSWSTYNPSSHTWSNDSIASNRGYTNGINVSGTSLRHVTNPNGLTYYGAWITLT